MTQIQAEHSAQAVADALDRYLLPTPTPTPRRRDEALLARAETFALAVGAWRLPGYAWGSGAPVLLAHGWGSRVAHLAAFVQPLVAAGCRVVAAEMPGHGPGPVAPSSLLQFALALRALGEAAAPCRGVIAHSGGALATTMALARGLRAERIALLAPMVRLERSSRRYAAAQGVDEERFMAGMLERFGPDLWQATSADLLAARLEVPALLVHDREDAEVPYQEAALLAKAWPGARLVTPEGVGHRLLLRDRATVAAVVGFVTG